MFKVGSRVVSKSRYGDKLTEGKEYEVLGIADGGFYFRVRCDNGQVEGFTAAQWLSAPVGPVVTETVTKTRIVPGTYDGVTISDMKHGYAHVQLFQCLSADQLDAAAAVLSALAKGLRDV